MRRAPLAIATICLLVPALTTACTTTDQPVAVAVASRTSVVEVVDVPASVTARAAATVSAPADGTLATLRVAPGDQVAKGAILATIDSPSARRRLEQAKAALGSASGGSLTGGANLAALQDQLDAQANEAFDAAIAAAQQIADPQLRQAALDRIAASAKRYHESSQRSKAVLRQLGRGLASIGSALAALTAAQRAQANSAYELAKATVDALTLRAPIAGVVQFAAPSSGSAADPLAGLLGSVGLPAAASATKSTAQPGVDSSWRVGDAVGSGASIITIVDVHELSLLGQIDETDVMLAAAGQGAEVELDAAPGVTYQAAVRSIDLLPTTSAQGAVSYRIRLSFADKFGVAGRPAPRPGMSAVAHLHVRTAVDVVAVPASAVFAADGGDAVWLVRDHVVVKQPVKLGVQGQELVEITSGLATGDQFVTNTDAVSAGQKLP